MIKAQDIRIGNWFTEGGKIIKINVDNIGIYADNPSCLESIPLSVDLLVTYGFAYKDHPFYENQILVYTDIIGFRKSNYSTSCDYFYFDFGKGYIGTSSIKYLHQVQNIYYAITGESIALPEIKDEIFIPENAKYVFTKTFIEDPNEGIAFFKGWFLVDNGKPDLYDIVEKNGKQTGCGFTKDSIGNLAEYIEEIKS